MKILNFNVSHFITSSGTLGSLKLTRRTNHEGVWAITIMNNEIISGKYDTYASLFSVDNLLTRLLRIFFALNLENKYHPPPTLAVAAVSCTQHKLPSKGLVAN